MIRLANTNKRGYFLLAVTASFATAYPCAPVFGLSARPNFAFDLHSSGRHYVEAAVWMTVCFSIAVPGILWLCGALASMRFEWGFKWALPFLGCVVGFAFGKLLCGHLATLYEMFSSFSLDHPAVDRLDYSYSAGLAGLIAGELCRRYFTANSRLAPEQSPEQPKTRFTASALMLWAVLLRAGECIVFLWGRPFQPTWPIYPMMFFTVLLWAPLACGYLWKHTPHSPMGATFRASMIGLIMPPLVGALLFPVVGLLILVGVNFYPMLWANMVFFSFLRLPPEKYYYLLTLLPGFIWGAVMGALRWRYLDAADDTSQLVARAAEVEC